MVVFPRTGGAIWWKLKGWRPGVVDWSGGVFASCIPRVQLYVNTCNGWPQFALKHHWLLPINCHFLRLYSAADRGIAAVSSAIKESDLYFFYSIHPKRSSIRAQAVYFLHSMMPSVTCLWLSDVSVSCRVTYFQFPIQSAFLPYIGRQAAPALRRTWFNIHYRTSDVAENLGRYVSYTELSLSIQPRGRTLNWFQTPTMCL